jgi:hypothetical protein
MAVAGAVHVQRSGRGIVVAAGALRCCSAWAGRGLRERQSEQHERREKASHTGC